MKKQIITLLTISLFCISLINAQWTNKGPLNDRLGQAHGLAVDGEGKIWASDWVNVTKFAVAPGDTLTKGVHLLYVFNPDGTQTSFSPIWRMHGAGVNDTMFNITNRGMRVNKDGNILIATGGPYLYLVDHKTGAVIKRSEKLKGSPTAPAVDQNGTIFLAPVVSGAFPITMYDQNLVEIGAAVTGAPGFSRSFEVSKDGNTIYWAGYDKKHIKVYSRADEFSSFELKDTTTVLPGASCESFTWHPTTGHLWMSGGSFNDLPVPGSGLTPGTWYAWDFTENKVVDSLKWAFNVPGAVGERPRSLAFSLDGNTAYIGAFGASGHPLVQKLEKGSTNIELENKLPETYTLAQNYPNPFNPSTSIEFQLPKQANVKLVVYNVVGQKVAEIASGEFAAGTHKVTFNANNLTSGVYVYRLVSENIVLTKKMLLVK